MQAQNNKLDFNVQNIYVGFDVHLKSWKVTIMTEKLLHKTVSQDPNPEILYDYLYKNFPGATYYSAYEAGFCGYWVHNRLKSLGEGGAIKSNKSLVNSQVSSCVLLCLKCLPAAGRLKKCILYYAN